jgi:hypothetical protein
MIYGVEIPDPDLGKVYKCGSVKPANGISILLG